MADEDSGLKVKKIAGAMWASLRRSNHAKRGKVGNEFRWAKMGVESLFVFMHPTSDALYECRRGFFARQVCFEQGAQ